MILGTGIDLVDSHRIKKLMKKYEGRFLERYFTDHEASYVENFDTEDAQAMGLAKRFAAKEACAKALGTGFRDGIYMKDIEVRNDEQGKPLLNLSNGALAQLLHLSNDKTTHIHLSLSDEPPYAQAQVIIEGI